MTKITIPHRLVHIAVFLLLAFLCYQGHQWVRHFTGAALCGGFGSLTFTVATPRGPCSPAVLETLSGPVFTYGLALAGLLLLRSKKYALFGYALIFASYVPHRFIQNLTGRGDELIIAQQWSAAPSRPAVALAVFFIGLLPVIAAFRAIANRRRGLVFAGSWLLPLPLLFAMLIGDQYIFTNGSRALFSKAVLGIPWVVLVTDLTALAVMLLVGPRYLRTDKANTAQP